MFQILVSVLLVMALLYGYLHEDEIIAWEQAHLFNKKGDAPEGAVSKKER